MESRFVPVRAGDDIFSIAVAGPAEAQGLAAQLRAGYGWLEVVPGIESVAVRFDAARMSAAEVSKRLSAAISDGIRPLADTGEVLEIPVTYGGDAGPDLETVCETLGISAEQFVRLHAGRDYRVDMVGFTPGFAFIGGLDERLRVPRRAAPRERVASGSVAIAGNRTGLYAIASPGGWNVVGRTDMQTFDPASDNPFRVRPGMHVRFRPIRAGSDPE